jgi:uncharacterized protein YjiS (DUF1127 family)
VPWCASRTALSASILLRARRRRYEPRIPFPPCDGGRAACLPDRCGTPAHRHRRTARARRSDGGYDRLRILRHVSRAATPAGAGRPLGTTARDPRCPDALQRSVLADVGIVREHIPLVAKGVDPADYQLRDPALRRWWTAARARLDAAREARRQRRRLYRELDAYNDRELEEIGLRRADIPAIVRGEPVYRRAA